MATIRAYKLAEELGIDRHEFVDKAAAVGVEVKSAMASLDDDQVSLLRDKLGRGEGSGRRMEERRVESKRGTTVLRRRKRAQPEPEPEPESVVLDAPIDGEPIGAAEEEAAMRRGLADARAYEIASINEAIGDNPNYVKLQALQALESISKDPAAKVYFLNSDSPNPLPLMHIGEDK